MSLREFLQSQGVPEPDIETAEEQGPEAVQLLAIDRLLVPGVRRYTQREVVERTGVGLETARKLWRAIGFPDVPEDEAAFTDSDIEALATLKQMIDQGVIDPGVALQLTRVYGQSLAPIADLGGRIVKMLGDEVMFVTDDPAPGARIAMHLAEAYADDETLPDVRVGLAVGPVLAREGDYFGPTVNLASRIVNISYAGSAVVSDEIHAALEGNEEFGWKALRPRRLKGIGWTPLWVLTRPGEGGDPRGLPAEVARRMRARRARRRAKEGDGDS